MPPLHERLVPSMAAVDSNGRPIGSGAGDVQGGRVVGRGRAVTSPASIAIRPDPPSSSNDYGYHQHRSFDEDDVVEGRMLHYDMNELSRQRITAISERYQRHLGSNDHQTIRASRSYDQYHQEHHHQHPQHHHRSVQVTFDLHNQRHQYDPYSRTNVGSNMNNANNNRPFDEASVASSGHHSTPPLSNDSNALALRWRMTDDDDHSVATATDTLCDWKLVVVHSITGDAKSYHVHRVVLAVGNNNNNNLGSSNGARDGGSGSGTCCGYFKKLFLAKLQSFEEEDDECTDDDDDEVDMSFDTTTSTGSSSSSSARNPYSLQAIKVTNSFKTSTTTIELIHAEACELFPKFLNYLYGMHATKSFDTKSVVGMYFLAKHFQHNQLQQVLVHDYIIHSIRNSATAIAAAAASGKENERVEVEENDPPVDNGSHHMADKSNSSSNQNNKVLLDLISRYYNDAIYFHRREILDIVAQECSKPSILRHIQPDCSFLYEMSPRFFIQLITMATSTTPVATTSSSGSNNGVVSPSRRRRHGDNGATGPVSTAMFLQRNQYHTSILVAEYCSIHCHVTLKQSSDEYDKIGGGSEGNTHITYDLFQQLTSRERLPVLDVRAALKFLVLEQHFLLQRRKEQFLNSQQEQDKRNNKRKSDVDDVSTTAAALSLAVSSLATSTHSQHTSSSNGDETQEQVNKMLNQQETKQQLQQLLLQQLPSCLQQRCIDTLAQGWVELQKMDSELVSVALQQLPNNIIIPLVKNVMKVARSQHSDLEVDFNEMLKREQYWKTCFNHVAQERDMAIEELESVNLHLQTTKSEVKGQLNGLIKRNESSKEEWVAERQYWLDQQDVWDTEREEFVEELESYRREKQQMKEELRDAKRELSKLKKRLAAGTRSDESTYSGGGGGGGRGGWSSRKKDHLTPLGELLDAAFSFDYDNDSSLYHDNDSSLR